MSTARGADLLVQSLVSAGVERAFTLSGNQILPVFDAALNANLDLIHVRHEAAAVHMADASGRLTGRPGVALVAAGPGFANALSALYVALCAEAPLVLLSGHTPRRQGGRGGFQQMAQAEMAGHVAKASWTVTEPGQMGDAVARAMRIAASGRPGPVHIGLPFDVLEEPVAKARGQQLGPDDFHPIVSLLDVATADAVLGHLASAQRPLLLAGPALCAAGRRAVLDQFAATTFVPALGLESPRGVNDPSLGGFAQVLAEADVVLLLGKRLDYTLNFGQPPTFDPGCRFLHVDPDAQVLHQTRRALEDSDRLTLTDVADPLPALERLLLRARERDWRRDDWFERVTDGVADRPREWATLRSPAAGPLHPAQVCRVVDEFLSQAEASVFVSDGGEFGQWAQANIDGTHRLINGPSGGIGSGLPFALAARLVHPDPDWRIAVTLGDGTLGFHLAEFDTAVRCELPVVVVVGNDARWNAEWQLQQRNYGADRVHGCELLPTRYDEAVRALGGHGEFVTRPDELGGALERAFAAGRPACVNVLIQPEPAPVFRS